MDIEPKPINQPLVLIVDDSPHNLSLMSELLKDTYRIKIANHGVKALRIAATKPQPDLILLDIMMPEMDGYDVCRQLKADPATRDIPVIFLTGSSGLGNEEKGLAMGAVDYLHKPISPPIMLARIQAQLALKASADFLRSKAAFLEQEVARRTREALAIQDVTILAMASLAETRDNETGNHIRRTQYYVKVLAEHLRSHPRLAPQLSEDYIKVLWKSAPLHDIGKIGIPDRILLKPGRLEPAEFEIMKTHTTLGWNAIQAAEDRLGMPVAFLSVAKEIALSHQEKWDGSGYPQGLAGEAIPLSARLMAVADVYDALISRRVYKPAMPHDTAAAIIIAGKGQHFDPDIVDAFIALQTEFQAIAARYQDTDADLTQKAGAIASAFGTAGC
ncbi:response regulator [Thiorhodovibrio frisius]|uniref:Response regulator containing a CheY-like receiver domain and an HD-GYP domain n=1 Tax=Thiorhodovibrio frisius TaxID=631362 RepID=H8Z2M5_9GAMM|nr:two-component system response regulator [Thiorhodovibrio frisius]EIC22718.1 response regulator containing a CheY-like receiver domain and an HD-GYP domain [Thiorhodovibrio frisius]WPL22475.1 Cyclic di-GMP phosphodiesterase response regulator RpfG [Thiorhodovibrio frisius]